MVNFEFSQRASLSRCYVEPEVNFVTLTVVVDVTAFDDLRTLG
jgi:hypothetical protein